VALRTGLLEYDRRHGWRGATDKVDLSKGASDADLEAELDQRPAVGGLRPAIVESVEDKSAKIFVKDMGSVTLPWTKLSWARRELPEEKTDRSPTQAAEILSRGDVIYTVGNSPQTLQFVQVPEAQSALVALDPKDGAVVALVGGFDFFQSKFNRVTQARRQPGSGFKPFVYAAAFDKGYTPASVVIDAPIVIDTAGNDVGWRPKEMEGEFFGPVRLREALAHSRNLVSVRLVRDIGVEYTRDYVTRFGFDKTHVPDDLTMALGTAELSPLQVVTGYSAFANGGFRVTPYYIDRILDASGKTIYQAQPLIACAQCAAGADSTSGVNAALADGRPPTGAGLIATAAATGANTANTANSPGADRGAGGAHPPQSSRTAGARDSLLDEGVHDGKSLIPARNLAPQILRPQVAYLLSDMMADVIRHGTGMKALVLGRDDIAGKTGTTNDAHDAWFSGFNADIVATVWTGFDQDRSLGELEQGSRAALPTWIFFMHEALSGVPRHKVPVPDGIVTVRISPDTGLLASADDPNGIMEKFIDGTLPKPGSPEGQNNQNPNDGDKPLF
jgi:penicillin-binding protein 1A